MVELKPGWRRVRFGDVVRLNKESCKQPALENIDRYIGLEHIEPGDLDIRSWGDVAEGTTFTNRVRPGQVLFGKRRAYQRKVAVARFDAVCSGDIYVFESANPALLLPELLPFVCQTDAFFGHAVGTSAGSLSPRTNWSSLAGHEFLLPPLEEQERISRVLSCATATQAALRELAQSAKALLEAATLDSFAQVAERRPLQTLCRSPITYGIVQAGPDLSDGVPYVRVSEMTGRDELDPSVMMRTSAEISAEYQRTVLEQDDIVVALRGVPGYCHIVRQNLVGANLSRGVARVAPHESVSARYVLWALRSPHVQAGVRQYANGWKGEDLREITIAQMRDLPVPFVPRRAQEAIVEYLDLLDDARRKARDRHVHFVTSTARELRAETMKATG